MNINDLNEKLQKQWTDLAKTFVEVGTETANETAGAAAEALKVISKELGGLGDRLEKWVEATKKAEAAAKPTEDARAEGAKETTANEPPKESSSRTL